MTLNRVLILAAAFCGLFAAAAVVAETAAAGTDPQASKPNILVIFGDDIGYWNLS